MHISSFPKYQAWILRNIRARNIMSKVWMFKLQILLYSHYHIHNKANYGDHPKFLILSVLNLAFLPFFFNLNHGQLKGKTKFSFPRYLTVALWFISHKFKKLYLALHCASNSNRETGVFACLLLPVPWTFCPVAKWKWKQYRMKPCTWITVAGTPSRFVSQWKGKTNTKTKYSSKTELFCMCFVPTLKICCLYCDSFSYIFEARFPYLWFLFQSLKIPYEDLDWERSISGPQKSTSQNL